MAQHLSMFTALPEDLSLVPRAHPRWLIMIYNSSSRGPNSLSWLLGTLHYVHTPTHGAKTQIPAVHKWSHQKSQVWPAIRLQGHRQFDVFTAYTRREPDECLLLCPPSSTGPQLSFDRHGKMTLSSINELCRIQSWAAGGL